MILTWSNSRKTRGRQFGAGGLAVPLLILLTACGASSATSSAGECDDLTVIATTTVLGDIAGNVLGRPVEVLMPVGADPHSFQPSARQIARLQDADLIVANGLGLEEGLTDVLESAIEDGVAALTATDHLALLPFDGGAPAVDHEDDAFSDPHFWTDPRRVADVAAALDETFTGLFPSCREAEAAEAYRRELRALDDEIERMMATIPEAERKLITNHQTMGYWADRYGFSVVGVVVPGGSTLAEPSPADLADLISTIEREGVRAIFAETTQPADLADAIASELGARIAVVSLYTGSLGPQGSGADTYLDMMRVNAQRVAGALAP